MQVPKVHQAVRRVMPLQALLVGGSTAAGRHVVDRPAIGHAT